MPNDTDRDLQERLRRVLTLCAAAGETLAYRDPRPTRGGSRTA